MVKLTSFGSRRNTQRLEHSLAISIRHGRVLRHLDHALQPLLLGLGLALQPLLLALQPLLLGLGLALQPLLLGLGLALRSIERFLS
jgi:hypothetical protein